MNPRRVDRSCVIAAYNMAISFHEPDMLETFVCLESRG